METFTELSDFLYGLRNRGSKLGLTRMQALMEQLGQPGSDLPIIHVAGTNGKGSVCAMLEVMYRKNGYHTGLFTSPHLQYLGERIQLNGQPIAVGDLMKGVQQIREIIGEAKGLSAEEEDNYPTFFEWMTALALKVFSEADVDVVILETGLGGRLDSTNVVTPSCTVITSVGLDHMEILGDTLAAIAAEKAGILKHGVPLVLGDLAPEAEHVVLERAKKLSVPVQQVGDYFADGLPQTNLAGPVMRHNAGLAVLVAEQLQAKLPISISLAHQALQEVHWPGRWELRQWSNTQIVLDCTHNEAGLATLQANVENWTEQTGEKPWIVVGILGEDRAKALLPTLAQWAKGFYLVAVDQPRALSTGQLQAAIPMDFVGELRQGKVQDLPAFWESCEVTHCLCTGSIYLMGELMDLWNESKASEAWKWQDVLGK